MRIVLMLLGAAMCVGALLFWIYLNGLAASWSTSNSKPSIDWLTGEALLWFWLPCGLGLAGAVVGWRRR